MTASEFGVFVGRLLRSVGLTSSEQSTLVAVASCTDDYKVCKKSANKIRLKSKQDIKTVYRNLATLRDKGYLQYTEVKGRPTHYYVLKPSTDRNPERVVIKMDFWCNFFAPYGHSRTDVSKMIDYLIRHYSKQMALNALYAIRAHNKEYGGPIGEKQFTWLIDNCREQLSGKSDDELS